MKLYEVKNKTWIKPDEYPIQPPASIPVNKGEDLFFLHVDGAYGVCRNLKGELTYIAAYTDIKKV